MYYLFLPLADNSPEAESMRPAIPQNYGERKKKMRLDKKKKASQIISKNIIEYSQKMVRKDYI